MAGSTSRAEAMQLAQTLKYLQREAMAQQAAAKPSAGKTAMDMAKSTLGSMAAKEAISAGAGALGLGGGTAAATGATAAGTTAATTTAAASPGLAALAPLGPYAAVVAAIAANGINYNRNSKKYKTTTSGKAFKQAIKDPVNWVLPTGLVGAAFGDKDMYLTEGLRGEKLAEKGVTGWDKLMATMPKLSKGRSKDELTRKDLAADFVGKDPQGVWVNNKFAQSRNEADLKPEDIWGYSAFGEAFGNDWLGKYSEDQRRQIAQKALDSGKVREHIGTLDIGDVDSLKAFASTLPPAVQQAQQTTSQGTRDKQGAPSGKKRASGKFPLAELPPLVSPTMPETDPKIADAYKRIFEENQGVTGNTPWRENPWLNILRR